MDLYNRITSFFNKNPVIFWIVGIFIASSWSLMFAEKKGFGIVNKLYFLSSLEVQTNLLLLLLVLLSSILLFFKFRKIFYSGRLKEEEIDFDIRGQGDRVVFSLSKAIPEVNIWLKITNLSIKPVILESVSFEIWDQQPIVEDNQNRNCEIAAKSSKDIVCKKNLTDTEKKRVFGKDNHFSGRLSAKAVFKEKYGKYKFGKQFHIDMEMKAEGNLNPQDKKIYLNLIEAAKEACCFKDWKAWTGSALSAEQRWDKDAPRRIREFRQKILAAIWPGSLPELECAIKTLARAIHEAMENFIEHNEREGNYLFGVKFNKIDEWNEEEYNKRLKDYAEWREKCDNLVLEATKGANWIAEVVRRDIDPDFYAAEGKFMVEIGPDERMRVKTLIPEFTPEEKKAVGVES